MPVFQINFSRPAGQIAAQYYDFVRLGREGYRQVHMASYDTGSYLADEIVNLGPFELICHSDLNKASPSWRGGSLTVPTRAIRCTTSPTGCASAAGRSRPTR